MTGNIRIERLETIGPREIDRLSDMLVDCVEGGASVSFMWPMTRDKADRFWRAVAEKARGGWQRGGEIPNYALMPDGAPCPTTVFYKALRD